MGEPEQSDQFPPDAVAAYLRNMSPRVVRVQGHGSELVLPPLYEVRLTKSQLEEFDVALLKVNPYVELDTGDVDQDEINATVLGGAAWLALVVAIVVGTVTNTWVWAGVAFVGVIIAGFVVRGAVRKGTSWTGATRWVREKAALLLVLVIGFGVPATVLLFGTGLFDDLRNDVGAALDPPLNQVVTYRALQVVFLGIATCFPALMYFQFDRQHLDTLRDRFLLALFRLDQTIDTAHDWDARYGKQITETIGKLRRGSLTSLFRSRRSPVVVATLVIALGWLLAFLNLDAVNDSGTSDVLVGGSLIRLFEPERGVVAFGFLGAYFFGVNAVLRSYLRGDLRPKAYNQITARILIVVVLSSLLSITNLGDEAVVLGLAFFAGIIPDTVLQLIAEQLPIRSVRVRRDRTADRPRGHRHLRPRPARRGRCHQRRGARPRRPDRAPAADPHPAAAPRRLGRPGDPARPPRQPGADEFRRTAPARHPWCDGPRECRREVRSRNGPRPRRTRQGAAGGARAVDPRRRMGARTHRVA